MDEPTKSEPTRPGRSYEMSRVIARSWITTAMMLCGALGAARAESVNGNTVADLPSAVLSAFQKAYPEDVIQNVDVEQKNDVTYFEIESKNGAHDRSVLYTVDGQLYEIEESVPITGLPAAVLDAAATSHPDGTIISAVSVWRDGPQGYELQIETDNGVSELVVASNGSVASISERTGGKMHDEQDDEDDDDEEEDDDEGDER